MEILKLPAVYVFAMAFLMLIPSEIYTRATTKTIERSGFSIEHHTDAAILLWTYLRS
jgi:hypothetical protein